QAKDIITGAGITGGRDTINHGFGWTFANHPAHDQFGHRAATLLRLFTQIIANLREFIWTHPDRVIGITEAETPLQHLRATATHPEGRSRREWGKDKGRKAHQLAFVRVYVVGKQSM